MNKFFLNRFHNYSFKKLQQDSLAGIIVGIVAIPLAMSFAIASGVKPEYGIYTACIAGIMIALFGGSKYQIGGPTGAFVPVLLGIVLVYGYADLLLAGLLAGILLCIMSFFKLGNLIKFIPKPVILGFTTGIAVIIFIGQIPNFLGLTDLKKHEQVVDNVAEILHHITSTNLLNVCIALLSFAIIIIISKYAPKIPSTLAGILISTIVVVLFFENQLPTIGSVYGEISSELPSFHVPEITMERLQRLIGPAIVIALLGAIESLLSAVVADEMTKTKHHSNRELFGQGVANIVTPLFGGIPATGAIARTATNIRSGAVSPISGIVHSIFVLLVLVVFAPYAALIPLASMAPILMIVAWNMSEQKQFFRIVKRKDSETIVLVTTFLLTVFTSLTTAVAVGIGLGILLFAKRMGNALTVSKMLPHHETDDDKLSAEMLTQLRNDAKISILTLEGPLFFLATQKLEKQLLTVYKEQPKVVILKMNKVPFIDLSAEATFKEMITYAIENNITVMLTGITKSLEKDLAHTDIVELVGNRQIFKQVTDAVDAALKS